jgi:hypothetical protein
MTHCDNFLIPKDAPECKYCMTINQQEKEHERQESSHGRRSSYEVLAVNSPNSLNSRKEQNLIIKKYHDLVGR